MIQEFVGMITYEAGIVVKEMTFPGHFAILDVRSEAYWREAGATRAAAPGAGLKRSPGKRGMPKCPRRWSRSNGLRLPEKAIRFRLVGLWKSTTAPVARMWWKLIHRSVAPPVEAECAVTRCSQPVAVYWRRTASSRLASYMPGAA